MERAGSQLLNSSDHPHYDHYSASNISRLDGFYGVVENALHQKILPYLNKGDSILDLGCGFGSLCHFLDKHGFKVTGVEQHLVSLEAAKQKFSHLDLIFDDGDWLDPVPEETFDVVVMKDVIHHVVSEVDAHVFMRKLYRICKQRIIIIDPNPTFILRTSRKIIKHVDPECPPQQALILLEKHGFSLKKLFFSEVLAFPLSGGYVGPAWIKAKFLIDLIMKVDWFLNRIVNLLGLSRFICWRYVIVAEKS